MTLIEGVGDEVIQFFLLVAIAIIAWIAWWSTSLSERPLIRTVFIVERRTIRRTPSDTQSIAAEAAESADVSPEGNELVTQNKTSQPESDMANPVELSVEQYENTEGIAADDYCADIISEDFHESLTAALIDGGTISPADEYVLRNRRLAFFNRRREQRNAAEGIEPVQSSTANPTDGNTSGEGCETEYPNDGNIRIRLKYLNDDQKLVEGKLQEQLGDFKRRHFSLELAGRKLVRLIFKGQVLQEDTKTLQNCGFFDNCVVHCLVQSRTPPPSPNLNRPHNDANGHENSHHWDLGNILFASLSLLLGLAWYGRFQYAQLYTATTTVTLVGLTGIFTVSLIGMYMPDMDGVRT